MLYVAILPSVARFGPCLCAVSSRPIPDEKAGWQWNVMHGIETQQDSLWVTQCWEMYSTKPGLQRRWCISRQFNDGIFDVRALPPLRCANSIQELHAALGRRLGSCSNLSKHWRDASGTLEFKGFVCKAKRWTPKLQLIADFVSRQKTCLLQSHRYS